MFSPASKDFLNFLVILWSSAFFKPVFPTCYFPDYFHGEYLTQTSIVINQVQYANFLITAESISTWGYCTQKISNELYLIGNENNGSYCIRCFHISMKSPNVLEVETSGNSDRCWLGEAAAETSCPRSNNTENTKKITLYKSSKDMKKVNCPINGKFMVRYQQIKPDRPTQPIDCSSPTSELNTCPVGSEINIRFQHCSFENRNITFECLGSWNGPGNQRFLAVHDIRSGIRQEARPRYRCGLYFEDAKTGLVYLTFSSDSTCVSDLTNAIYGYETFTLTPSFNSLEHVSKCRFPYWMEGTWDSATITHQIFTYTDQILFTTYSFQCENDADATHEYSMLSTDEKKLLVYGKSTCGEEIYTCIWAKRRGVNVIEFQLARPFGLNYDDTLCSSTNFQQDQWITLARTDFVQTTPCPIEGEYVGTLPNTQGFCAKLSSDCSTTDTMYYTISDCVQQVYEDNRRRFRRSPKPDRTLVKSTSATMSSPSSTLSPSTYTLEKTPTAFTESIEAVSEKSSATSLDKFSGTNRYNQPSKSIVASASAQPNNVQSYFLENKNFSALLNEDGGFDISTLTFLPPPISYSTHSTFPNSSDQTRKFDQNRLAHQTPYYQSENHQTQERLKQTIYHNWNRSTEIQNSVNSGPHYFIDPNSANQHQQPVHSTQIFHTNINANNFGYGSGPNYRRIPYRVFRDREYRCLAFWKENGSTYTFTEHKNTGTYECFVGFQITETEFSIREAGRHCARNYISPLALDMTLIKRSSCVINPNSSTNSFRPYPGAPIIPPISVIPVISTLEPPDTTTNFSTNKYNNPKKLPPVPQYSTTISWQSPNNLSSNGFGSAFPGKNAGSLGNSAKIIRSSYISVGTTFALVHMFSISQIFLHSR